MAVDDSVFRRSGRKVYGAVWQHDGSSPARDKLSFGTCFVTAGIIVTLPFCARSACLPVLARLHVPGKGRAVKPRRQAAPASTVSCAAALVSLLATAFPGRRIDVVADAHYHGPDKSQPSWQPGTPPPHNCETPGSIEFLESIGLHVCGARLINRRRHAVDSMQAISTNPA